MGKALLISLTLPWPPSINHYYGSRGNRRFIKKEGVLFRATVAKLAIGCVKEVGRLAMFITVYPPDKRRRDLDNLVKATQDALQHAGCYEDDCQIDGLRVLREDIVAGGKVNVVICQHRTVGCKKHPSAKPIADYWEHLAYNSDDYPDNGPESAR